MSLFHCIRETLIHPPRRESSPRNRKYSYRANLAPHLLGQQRRFHTLRARSDSYLLIATSEFDECLQADSRRSLGTPRSASTRVNFI